MSGEAAGEAQQQQGGCSVHVRVVAGVREGTASGDGADGWDGVVLELVQYNGNV